jgi:threonine dehydrogenase-like Zn-dependent dehydrogenase
VKAVVWHGVGDIRLDDVPEPTIQKATDATVRLTASAIYGTDLHFVRGTMTGLNSGRILGHEGVGIIEQLGDKVRNFNVGDRVVICSTISCGTCSYCRAGSTAQCDNANPGGAGAGTAFFGGPEAAGGIDGLQAEKARIPFAASTMVKLPDAVSDDQAILISDIFPTAWFGASLAEITEGDTVAVFGCGPVGQFAVASAMLQGAFTVNFEEEDPVEAIQKLTGGVGVDRVIDAVGVDAQHAHHGPAAREAHQHEPEFAAEQEQVSPKQHPTKDGNLVPGDAPGQVLRWATKAVAKAGTISIIGVYPMEAQSFPLSVAMNRNLSINLGSCNHRSYVPKLVDMVRVGVIDPVKILTKRETLTGAIEAYEQFDKRMPGWVKTELNPAA